MAFAGALVTPAVHAAPTQEALALTSFEDGRRLFAAKKYDEALRAFQASQEAMPSPNSRLYIGRCLLALGKTASAYSTLRMASREAEDRVLATGDKRYAATQQSAALEASRLESLVPRIALTVEAGAKTRAEDLERAHVTIDGAAIPRTAWASHLELDPGDHAIVLAGSRLARVETRVSLAEGETKTVALVATREPSGAVRVVLKTRPAGLAVEIDGEPINLTDSELGRDVAVGTHRLTARAPGYDVFAWSGPVADEAIVDVPVELVAARTQAPRIENESRASGTPRWLFFASAGAAIASAGVGAFFLLDARAADASEQQKPVAERDPQARDDIRSRAQTGSVLLAVGGGLAVVTTVLGFTTKWRSAQTGLAVTPVFAAGGAGLAGEF